MRVVITHDFAESYGGAERVTQEIAAAFPDAPVVGLAGRPEVTHRMGVADRWTSVLSPRPRVLTHYRALTPFFPALARGTTLPAADVLISSTYAFAHHFELPGAAHIAYCHSPLRFAWSMTDDYAAHLGPARPVVNLLAERMRRIDRRAAEKVSRFVTQSPFVATQIRTSYGREAEAIGVPLDTDLFSPAPGGNERGDHFLLCGRLIDPYKKVLATVEAFRRMPDRKLVIVGDGPAFAAARARATPNIELVGPRDDAGVVDAMRRASALLFPSRDDFGLVAVEAMACGTPVLAFAGGGALHTVAPGVSGELFPGQTAEAIQAAVEAFDPERYDPAAIRAHALQWGREAFHARLRREVADALAAR